MQHQGVIGSIVIWVIFNWLVGWSVSVHLTLLLRHLLRLLLFVRPPSFSHFLANFIPELTVPWDCVTLFSVASSRNSVSFPMQLLCSVRCSVCVPIERLCGEKKIELGILHYGKRFLKYTLILFEYQLSASSPEPSA